MSKGRYVYYQPNKKDIEDKYGDCTVRALSKALGVTWLEAFDAMIPLCREEQVSNIFNAPIKVKVRMIEKLGFKYHGISNKRGSTRPTVEEFARAHANGTFMVSVANHVVAVVDGKYYDTWNSGRCCLYGYYEKENNNEH